MMEAGIAKMGIGKMAKNCTACRASKVKCQLDSSSACTRCERLGLQCIFVESKRGQSCTKRDQARLGPVVRALLRATATADGANNGMQDELDRTHAADEDSFCWNGNDCQRKMVQSISNADGQLALLKHWLLIGVRSGSCGLLGNILLLAHSCSIPLDAIDLTIARPLPPVPPADLELPHYIRTWLDDARRLCCVRSQVQGVVSWRPNHTFVHEVGDESTLRGALQAAVPGLNESVDFLICTAEMFLAVPIHAEDRPALARLNGLLWSNLAPSADGARVAEAVVPVLVRCQLRTPDQENRAAAAEYTICTLSGRTVVYPDTHAVHSAFSLVPFSLLPISTAPPDTQVPLSNISPDAQGPRGLPVGLPANLPVGLPANPPVGLPQWPVGEVHTEMIAAAQAMEEGAGGYDLLADLGLDFDPRDVDMLIRGGNSSSVDM